MNKPSQTLTFYQFLAAHSLLIGLLPFYLPVYLWKSGHSLAELCLLIGLSGISFCCVLRLWQTLAQRLSQQRLLCIPFALEVVLISCLWLFEDSVWLIAVLGLCNGLYNGFFWTSQRTLFLQLFGDGQAGRHYGNFQILVAIFLKIGILLGGLFLDADRLLTLLGLSLLVSATAAVWIYRRSPSTPLIQNRATIPLSHSLRFNDQNHSRLVFLADGFFIFLESHFWTLTLFLVSSQSFAHFGVLVIALTIVFSLLFYLIKNAIDGFSGNTVFTLAVALYSLSWLARLVVEDGMSTQWLTILLIFITFCTSFFRLAFNKRFFELARNGNGIDYLMIKSDQSQISAAVCYLCFACVLWSGQFDTVVAMQVVYLLAACIAILYLAYQKNSHK